MEDKVNLEVNDVQNDVLKLLRLDICFRLPNDFNGNLNDAIRCLLEYREIKEKNHDKLFISNPDQTIYENWFDMVNTTNRKLFGEVSISSLNEQNGWDNIEL